MRGPQLNHRLLERKGGITPAYAGTTTCASWRGYTSKDHPRLCGDHPKKELIKMKLKGSPPLMRGPPRRVRLPENNRGITPAYAGTTERNQC